VSSVKLFLLFFEDKSYILDPAHMPKNEFFVYIATDNNNEVLYTGVTDNLKTRMWEHQQGQVPQNIKPYNITKLVHSEIYSQIDIALKRAEELKQMTQEKKLALIFKTNPHMRDL